MPHWLDAAGFARFLAAVARALLAVDGRPALIAGLAALALGGLARLTRHPALGAASAAAGLALGWHQMFGGFLSAPHMLPNRVALIGPAALVAALLLAARPRAVPWVEAGLALFAAWWLGGAPHAAADLRVALPVLLGGALSIGVLARLLRSGGPGAGTVAGLVLFAALVLAGAGPVWRVIALVPLGAGLGALAAPAGPGLLVALAGGVGSAAMGAVLAEGRLGTGGIGPIDLAAFAPLAALWLAPHLVPRLSRLGRAAPAAALVVAGASVILAGALARYTMAR